MAHADIPAAPLPAPPAAEQVQAALAHIERSAVFKPSRRHRHLLRHLVERLLSGDQAALKESVIAVEVFGRPASRFDPKLDTIVRVETRRLRQRLDSYFRNEGRDQPLRIDLPVGSYVPLIASRTSPAQAYAATRRARDLVERGEAFLRQALSRATLEQALARFDAALRESPDHVPALVGMGRAWFNLASGWYHAPRPAAEHAGEALQRAVARDPGHAQAHALLGALLHTFERDWLAARRAFQQAVDLAPDQAFVQAAFGRHLLMRGELPAAEARLALARQLDPQYVNIRVHMVNLRILQGRLDDADAELDGLRDLAPGSMPALGVAGLLALLRGQGGLALQHFREACALAPDYPACQAAVAGALGACGQVDEADATLAQLRQQHGEQAVSPYVLAIVAARCGRADPAFAQLERCLHECDPNTVWLQFDPSLRALHADPRWPALVAAMRRRRS